MKKPILTAALWVYVGWYAGNLLSELTRTSPLVVVIPTVVLAVMFARQSVRRTEV